MNAEVKELLDRVNAAFRTLGGNVSEMRRESVEQHLASVASNLEADVRLLRGIQTGIQTTPAGVPRATGSPVAPAS